MVKMRLILSLQLHSVVRPSIKRKQNKRKAKGREHGAFTANECKLHRHLVQSVVSMNRVNDIKPRKSENQLTARTYLLEVNICGNASYNEMCAVSFWVAQ